MFSDVWQKCPTSTGIDSLVGRPGSTQGILSRGLQWSTLDKTCRGNLSIYGTSGAW